MTSRVDFKKTGAYGLQDPDSGLHGQDCGLEDPDLICSQFTIAVLRAPGTMEPHINSSSSLVIFFSLTDAPLNDTTPTQPNTPRRARNRPETDPKRTETEPNRTETKSLLFGAARNMTWQKSSNGMNLQ